MKEAEVGKIASQVMEQMAKSLRRSDESFEDFLRRSHHSVDTKNWTRVQAEGFNAARSDSISVGSIIRGKALERPLLNRSPILGSLPARRQILMDTVVQCMERLRAAAEVPR